MAPPTRAQLATARTLLGRAEARFGGAETAALRPNPSEGEFDNNFDGVVSGIFHVVDAFELVTTGLRREAREAEQATRIRSVLTALDRAGVGTVPSAARLLDLNSRRNTSVHGDWQEVLDVDALEDAISAGRELRTAVLAYCAKTGIVI